MTLPTFRITTSMTHKILSTTLSWGSTPYTY